MTVSPDEGMQLIAQRMAADKQVNGSGPAEQQPAAGLEVDADINFVLALRSALADNTKALQRPRRMALIPWEWCHPVPLEPVASPGNAAGLISDERWEPREGFAWQVTSVVVVFGAGTTQATVYRDAVGAQNQRNQQATGFIWEPKAEILMPGNRLVFNSVGGPITVNGYAIEIALDFLPAYLA